MVAMGFAILSLYNLVSLSANRGLLLEYLRCFPEKRGGQECIPKSQRGKINIADCL